MYSLLQGLYDHLAFPHSLQKKETKLNEYREALKMDFAHADVLPQ